MIHVLTVAHPRFDTRIWIKEITSLVNAGYKVKYHVADGGGNQNKNGVEIVDYGAIPSGSGAWFRLKKMFQVMAHSSLKRGDWVHFHDGIFLPFALLLALKGCRVIYDVHEDYPRQVLNSRFPFLFKLLWAKTLESLEWLSRYTFKAYFTATPKIADRFPLKKTWVIHNFPLKDELISADTIESDTLEESHDYMFYVGALAEVRGLKQMVGAIEHAASLNERVRLVIGGNYSPLDFRDKLRAMPGWNFTKELGWMNRQQIASWLAKSKVGLVILHPTKNYPDAYPVKLFEYMSAGIPVIASNFPLWKGIIEEAGCGLLVDPLDPLEISQAMTWIVDNPVSAHKMGTAGRKAVENTYNWENEEKKLIEAYRKLAVESFE
jgi:glycosyltransferase involved in cell wall biosynthesis